MTAQTTATAAALTLVDAARTVIAQRDHHAEEGKYNPAMPVPAPDQEFDDYAADLLQDALKNAGLSIALKGDEDTSSEGALTHSAAKLAKAVHDAAVHAGIINDGTPLTGPQCIMLIDQMGMAARHVESAMLILATADEHGDLTAWAKDAEHFNEDTKHLAQRVEKWLEALAADASYPMFAPVPQAFTVALQDLMADWTDFISAEPADEFHSQIVVASESGN